MLKYNYAKFQANRLKIFIHINFQLLKYLIVGTIPVKNSAILVLGVNMSASTSFFKKILKIIICHYNKILVLVIISFYSQFYKSLFSFYCTYEYNMFCISYLLNYVCHAKFLQFLFIAFMSG